MAETATLTLPDGTVFESSRGVTVNYQHQANFFINTGSRLGTFYEQYVNDRGGQTDKGDGLGQNFYLIPGLEHAIELSMVDHVDNDGQWGGAASSDSVQTRSQTLDRELNTQVIDSGNIAEFSYAEYSSSGAYDPIPVVVLQSNILDDAPEGPSSYTVNMTLAEAADGTAAIDAIEQLLR